MFKNVIYTLFLNHIILYLPKPSKYGRYIQSIASAVILGDFR